MLLSLLFFFIPFLLQHTFLAAYAIPATSFTTWQYPASPIDLPDEKEGERLYVIGFEIAKKDTDRQRTYFRAKAPEGMILGELYYRLLPTTITNCRVKHRSASSTKKGSRRNGISGQGPGGTSARGYWMPQRPCMKTGSAEYHDDF